MATLLITTYFNANLGILTLLPFQVRSTKKGQNWKKAGSMLVNLESLSMGSISKNLLTAVINSLSPRRPPTPLRRSNNLPRCRGLRISPVLPAHLPFPHLPGIIQPKQRLLRHHKLLPRPSNLLPSPPPPCTARSPTRWDSSQTAPAPQQTTSTPARQPSPNPFRCRSTSSPNPS